MRYIFLTLGYTPDIDGGGYRYATEVAELLAARGREVHALYPRPKPELPERERRAGVELWRTPRPGGGFFANWRAANRGVRANLSKLLADPQPTFILSHHAYLAPAAKGLGCPVILQGPWAGEHRLSVAARPRSPLHGIRDAVVCRVMARVERGHLKRASRVFVASRYSMRSLAFWHPGLHCDPEVVGGGANLGRFRPAADRDALRAERGLARDSFLFLAVRRLDPRMGLLHLVEAFAAAAAGRLGVRLWIAGKGPQKEALQSRIDALGLGDRVRLLGFVSEDELPRLYAAADTVLMPSLDLEGFGLATAEALACGTPVLASEAGANPELLAPLGEGLLFPVGDTAALAAMLGGVLSGSRPLPPRDACADYARKAFKWDGPVDAFERAAGLLALRGAPRGWV
jgi:glycosyltransferase involved in cell wall biosynthesis